MAPFAGKHLITGGLRGGARMRDSHGFVLVEVLMDGVAVGALVAVVALIAVQSVVAFPRWSDSRDQTHLDALRWELENVAAHQAIHRADHGGYAGSTEVLGFSPSNGVRVEIVASRWGWSATAAHAELSADDGCAVYAGTALPPDHPLTPSRKGEVACTS